MALLNVRRSLAALAAVALSAALVTGCGSHAHGNAARPAGAVPSGPSGPGSPGSPPGSGAANAGGSPSTGSGAGNGSSAGHPGVDYSTLAASLTAHGVHLLKPAQIAVTPAIQVGPFLTAYAMRTAQLTSGSLWFGAWRDHAGMAAMVNLVKAGNISPRVDHAWTDGDWMVMVQASTGPLTSSVATALKTVGAAQVFP